MSKSSCSEITPCERGGCPHGKVCGNKNRCITVGKDVWNRVCSGHHPLSPSPPPKKSPKASKISSPSRHRVCDHTNICQTLPCPRHRDGRRRACSIKGNCVLHGGAAWKKSGCEKHSTPPRPVFNPPVRPPRPVLKPPKKSHKDRLRAGWYARQYPRPWGDRCDIRKDGDYKCLLQRQNRSPYWASPSKSGAGQEACEDWSSRCQDPEHV